MVLIFNIYFFIVKIVIKNRVSSLNTVDIYKYN